MAEQTPENASGQAYQPALTDWRGLIVLAPELGQDACLEDVQALRAALGTSALGLSGLTVSTPEVSDTVEVSFYIGDQPQEAAVAESIGSVCQATLEAGLRMEFVGMQLGRAFDVEVYGEEYLASNDCNVGESANDAYRYFTDAHDSLDRLD